MGNRYRHKAMPAAVRHILSQIKAAEEYHHPDERRYFIRQKAEADGHKLEYIYDYISTDGDRVLGAVIDGDDWYLSDYPDL